MSKKKVSNGNNHSADLSEREVLMAILAMLVDEREAKMESDPARRRTELVLAGAGLSAATIAALLNKRVGTVEMAIYRDKKKSQNGKASGGSDA